MIGIIGAMEEEITLLRSALSNSASEIVHTFEFIQGNLDGVPVVLLRSGIGKVNAAVGCTLLLQTYGVQGVVNTGSAGGIDPSLTFGDVIISDALTYHDVDVRAFGYAAGQVPGSPATFSVPQNLIEAAEQAVEELKREGKLPPTLQHRRGLIGSGDQFIHTSERIAQIRKDFPTLRAIEMEGAAIAHTCALFAVPALIIRSVSDVAGSESPMTFDQFLPIASRHSSEIVRRIVSKEESLWKR
jgi:adenosylhomocysteine nucleosidase